MPFTISHAAAALPLRSLSRRLPLAALMIGSMAPDFAYFSVGEVDGVWSHDIAGVFLFCWPVSLLLWCVYVRWLEPPTLALLPEHWRAVFVPSDRTLGFKVLAFASAAVLLGALSHVAWDSFTHAGTWTVRMLPVLRTQVFEFRGSPMRVYHLLQHLSTVLGLLVLIGWVVKRHRLAATLRVKPPAAPVISNRVRAIALALLLASTFALALANYAQWPEAGFGLRLFHLAIGGMTGWAMAWIGLALFIKLRFKVHEKG